MAKKERLTAARVFTHTYDIFRDRESGPLSSFLGSSSVTWKRRLNPNELHILSVLHRSESSTQLYIYSIITNYLSIEPIETYN